MTIWTLAIYHHTGLHTSIHGTGEEAKAALIEFVDDAWDAEMCDPRPKNPDAMVEIYFDSTPYGHAIEEHDLDFLEVP